MLDNPNVAEPLTPWFFTKPNRGWKIGVRVVRFVKFDKTINIQVQRWRTNKERNWVPTNRWINLNFVDAKEIFGKLLGKVMEDYAKTAP